MARDLRGKSIVITGASSGIGAATAVACARHGMAVALGARRLEKLEQIGQQCRLAGAADVLTMACDVQRDEDVDQFIDAAHAQFGRLDAVFANAGYLLYAGSADVEDAQLRDIFETNFFGTVRCIRKAAPIMLQQKAGHILICSSAVSEIGIPMYGVYAATKAAQDAVGCALRAELADRGVNVSTIHPVGTETDLYTDVPQSPASDQHARYNTPSPLSHTAEKVADKIVACLKKPKAEVWPSVGARLGLAIITAFPFLGATAMRDLYRKRYIKGQS